MMKKGQEEIVGFVVVVVLISIVFLIFLSFSLRSQPATRESASVDMFLQSLYALTSNCSYSSGTEFASVGEVLSGCADNKICDDGKDSCIVLNSSLPLAIEAGLRIGGDRPIKGYRFSAGLVNVENGSLKDNGVAKKFYTLSKGNCSNGQRGSSEFSPANGALVRSELVLCA